MSFATPSLSVSAASRQSLSSVPELSIFGCEFPWRLVFVGSLLEVLLSNPSQSPSSSTSSDPPETPEFAGLAESAVPSPSVSCPSVYLGNHHCLHPNPNNLAMQDLYCCQCLTIQNLNCFLQNVIVRIVCIVDSASHVCVQIRWCDIGLVVPLPFSVVGNSIIVGINVDIVVTNRHHQSHR